MDISFGLMDKLIGTQLTPQPRFLAKVGEVECENIDLLGPIVLRIKFTWAVCRKPDGSYVDCPNFLGQDIPLVQASQLRLKEDGSYSLTGVDNSLYGSDEHIFYPEGHPGFVGDGSNPSAD